MRYLRCDEKTKGVEDSHEKTELTKIYPSLDDQASRHPAARAKPGPGAARVQAHLTDREQHRPQQAQDEHQALAQRAHEYEASSARRAALTATGIKIKHQGHLEELP